jgi:hypothetical protein
VEKLSRSPSELAHAVQQLESLGFTVAENWKRGLTVLEGLDVLVRGPLDTAVFYAESLFNWTEISRTRDGTASLRSGPA